MTTLQRLLEDSDSPLIKVDMKEALRPDIFDKLPIDAIESLCDLLPLADLVFVRARPDHGPEDKLEIIQPESIEHVNQLKQDPWCALYISSGVFNNPDFKTAWEDFIILLGDGYYEPEDEEDEEDIQRKKQSIVEAENEKEPVKEAEKGRRKRKASDAIAEEDENAFKDDQYERYWGERLEKQQKKRKERIPKWKKSVQEQESANIDEISMEEEKQQTILDSTTKAQPTKRGRGRTPKSKKLVQGQELQVADELSIEGATRKKSEPGKRGRGRPKKQE